ncbi:MAG: hypothetical protein FWB90_05840 [Fibromonadales bacterium]|nr:hypothetical protein [Fibromonadales bacterium]MCL2207602.1 hypothetical protein [Fibromonadales bacterium]
MKYFLLLLSLLLLGSCGSYEGNSDYKSFNWRLQGVWEKANGESWEDATIKIDYNNISITGTVYHFSGFPRGVELEAYADTSFIYIKVSGEWQTVSYVYWETGSYPKTKMLTLKGHSYYEPEIFKFVEEQY